MVGLNLEDLNSCLLQKKGRTDIKAGKNKFIYRLFTDTVNLIFMDPCIIIKIV
jgi:hypothetical protein